MKQDWFIIDKSGQRGAVLTMTLVFFVVFLVIAAAWLGFAVRQSHEVTDQEQEEQAFQVAEAGVEYTLFLLNSGVYTVDGLVGLSSPIVQVVSDAAGKIVGSYELTFSNTGGTPLTVSALARDLELEGRCQRIVADIEAMTGALAGTEYYVRSWNHDLRVTCGAPGVVTALPTVKFNPTGVMVLVEGDPPDVNQAAFTIVLSHVYPLRVTVDFRAEGYSWAPATPGEDFVPADQAVVFDPGEVSKTVIVDIVADNVWERWGFWWLIEYLRGVISNPRNGSLVAPTSRNVWIVDDD